MISQYFKNNKRHNDIMYILKDNGDLLKFSVLMCCA